MTIETKVRGLQDGLARARQELAQLAATETYSDALWSAIRKVAIYEGEITVWSEYHEVYADASARHPDDPSRVQYQCMRNLTRLLMNGPDDTWSGRGNDTRRARYDGKCTAVQDVYYDILNQHRHLSD